MFLVIAGIVIVGWLLFAGWRFYHQIDWNEPAEPSPDFGAMRKRQAELQHIQDVLQEAHDAGKLSKAVIDEFNRFCDAEEAEMKSEETAWKNRRKL